MWLQYQSRAVVRGIAIMMDRASWHTSSNLVIPDNMTIIHQPSYSPEVQPAEHLWQFTDQPIINTCPDSLDHLKQTLSEQCQYLKSNPDIIKQATCFHWWPAN